MRNFFYLFLLFFGLSAYASDIKLKEKLATAEAGSYLVIEQNKTFTFLHVHSVFPDKVIIEEVSIPGANFSADSMQWKEWFEKGAPGHTSWIMSQINLNTGSMEETFSFTHKGWINLSETDPFFSTLLNLSFKEVPLAERRRIGLPPGMHKEDKRPLWNPRLTVNGKVVPTASFSVYKTRWPTDGSDLSHRMVEIYLPENASNEADAPRYPLYFPYWLEVDGRFGKSKVRVIDSGFEAESPKKFLPKRPLKLKEGAKMSALGLTLQIDSPAYYHDFLVVAEDVDSFFGNTFPLPCQVIPQNNGSFALFIPKENLEDLAELEHSFRFLISPKEDPTLCLTTAMPIKIR